MVHVLGFFHGVIMKQGFLVKNKGRNGRKNDQKKEKDALNNNGSTLKSNVSVTVMTGCWYKGKVFWGHFEWL